MTNHIPDNQQKHVVIGAGPAGRATAAHLRNLDHQVVLLSRSGSGPTLHGVERLAVDATDAQPLTAPMPCTTASTQHPMRDGPPNGRPFTLH